MQPKFVTDLSEGQIAQGLQDALQLFNYTQFKPEQELLIRAIIEGRDVLGIFPTGYGKSACFQIPGIIRHLKTLVVSPLIALQEDQIRSLRKLGIKAFCLHSGLDEAKKKAVYFYYKNPPVGETSFLYLSPELLLTEAFHQRFDGVFFDHVAVDEAHCVSTWGDAFRPDYQRIRVAVHRLHIPQCSAFTATIDPKIERDIRRRIPIRPGFFRVEASPLRSNLKLTVTYPATLYDSSVRLGKKKFNRLLTLLNKGEYAGPTIVYCSTRDATVSLWKRVQRAPACWYFKDRGYSAYVFHAGLPYEDKQLALEGFLSDPRPVIFATSAFGMGIDRADVRQVIHYSLPNTLIDYAQQIGRAGRDGKPSLCTTFHVRGDTLELRTAKSEWDVPTYDFIEMVHRRLRQLLARRTLKERKHYNIRMFANHVRFLVENSTKIKYKRSYLARFNASLAMLQRARVIKEDHDGLAVFDIMPGTKAHLDLLEMAKMQERKLVREADRLVRFFGPSSRNQQLLWDILRTDDYPIEDPSQGEEVQQEE